MGYLKQAMIGTGWMAGLRAFNRGLGFVKLAIVARLLTPQDFGVFGVAAIALAFLEIFTETGIYVFLIQEKEDVDQYINTAWVVSIIRGLIIAMALVLFGTSIATFFKAESAAPLIMIMGLVAFIRGFINPSIIKIQKELQFRKEFTIRNLIIVVEVVTTIVAAIIWRSPLSLAIGVLCSAIAEVIISLMVIEPKPRFTYEKEKIKQMISKGKWVTTAGILGFLTRQGDSAVVAKLLDSSALGLYQIAYKIATLPGTEIADVLSKVTFPVYAKIEHDKQRLLRAFTKTTLTSAVVIIPFSLILLLFPRQILHILVGDQWLGAQQSLQILALFGAIGALLGSRNAAFFALRRQDLVSKITFTKFLALAIVIVPLVRWYGIEGAAIASLLSVLVVFPVSIYYLVKVFKSV